MHFVISEITITVTKSDIQMVDLGPVFEWSARWSETGLKNPVYGQKMSGI